MIIQAMPYPPAVGGGGAPYWTNEALSENAVPSVYTSKVSLTVPAGEQSAGKTYLVLWQIQASPLDPANVETQLRIDGAQKSYHRIETGRQDAGGLWNYLTHGGYQVFTASATPADVTIDIQTRGTGGGSQKNARITVVELQGGFITTTTGDSSTTSTSMVSAATLTVPSGNDGDYILLVSFDCRRAGTDTLVGRSRLGGAITTPEVPHNGINYRDPRVFALPVTVSGATSFQVEHRSENSAVNSVVSNIVMVVVPVSMFADVDAISLGTSSAGTDATYTNALTQSAGISGSALVIAAGMMGNSSTTLSARARFTEGGTTKQDIRAEAARSLNAFCLFDHEVRTLSGPVTQNIDRQSETTGTTTTIYGGAGIVAMQL